MSGRDRRSLALRILVALVAALPLVSTVVPSVEAGAPDPGQALNWFGERFIKRPAKAVVRATRHAVKEVDKATNKVVNGVYRATYKAVPKPLRPTYKAGLQWKANALQKGVKVLNQARRGLQTLGRVQKPFRSVEKFNSEVRHVQQKVRDGADAMRRYGENVQHGVDSALVHAVGSGQIDAKQAMAVWRSGLEHNRAAHQIADRVDRVADKITPRNVAREGGRLVVNEALPRGLRLLKDVVSGGKRPSSGPKRPLSDLQKVQREANRVLGRAAGETLKEVVGPAVTEAFAAQGKSVAGRFALAKAIQHFTSPEQRRELQDAVRAGTGAAAVWKALEKGEAIPPAAVERALTGDAKGACAASDRRPAYRRESPPRTI